MKITMAEAIKLKGMLTQRYNELAQERRNNATVKVKSLDAQVTIPERTVQIITEEANVLNEHAAELSVLLATANLSQTVTVDGRTFPLVMALDLVKTLRDELRDIKSLSKAKDGVLNDGYSGDYYVKLLYATEPLIEQVKELERTVTRLSNAINAVNFTAEIEVPFADLYM